MASRPTRPQPWDRQPGETDPAWAAFITYRDMGLKRSLAKVGRELGKSKQLVEGWSSKNAWVLRVQQWDAEQDRLWQVELRHHARRAAQKNVTVANKAVKLAATRLEELLDHPYNRMEMKAGEVATLLNSALKLQQAVMGPSFTGHLPAGAGKVPGSGSPFDDLDLDELPDEEIRLHMLALERELQADLAEYDRAAAGEDPSDRDPEDDE